MALPTQKTPPKASLADLTVLAYGRNKIGKSSLCSHADGALFLACEPGLNSLEVYQMPIGSWDEMLAACAEVAEGKHPFRTIIVDTVDQCFRLCVDHTLRKFKVEHESDLPYGKGYALINNEFYRVLNKLALLPYGLWLISHAQVKEIDTSRGKILRTMPTLPDKARKLVLGMADMILYFDATQDPSDPASPPRRIIRTKPNLYYEAGDRTGRLPETLEMSYAAFVDAFEKATSGNLRP